MKKLINNQYFSITFIPGIVFGIVVDVNEECLYLVFGFIEIDVKLWSFRKNKK